MIPARHTVTRAAYQAGTLDAHGNQTDSWAAATDVKVYGWAPASADREIPEQGRDGIQRDVDLYAPAGTTSTPRDRWTLNGLTFEAVGHPEDFTNGPWQVGHAGLRISLIRIEG